MTKLQNNNLPPIDWYSLERASNLLGCYIEDFITWHNSGTLNLAVNASSFGCCLHLDYYHTDNYWKISEKSKFKHEDVLRRKVSKLFPQYSQMSNYSKLIIDENETSSEISIFGLISGYWIISGQLNKLNVKAFLPDKELFQLGNNNSLIFPVEYYGYSEDVKKMFEGDTSIYINILENKFITPNDLFIHRSIIEQLRSGKILKDKYTEKQKNNDFRYWDKVAEDTQKYYFKLGYAITKQSLAKKLSERYPLAENSIMRDWLKSVKPLPELKKQNNNITQLREFELILPDK